MKARKSFFSRVHYSNCVHYKYKKNKENPNKSKNKLLKNLDYYSRNEKKQILKKIYENIILKKKHLQEELLQFYINDKDVKEIFEKEKIFDESDKLAIIKQVESNEEALINKFSNFFDLLHFSLEKFKIKGGFFVNQNTSKLNDLSSCTRNNALERHEFIASNLDLIKKFLVFIDKNLDIYEKTSTWFKIFFRLNKFVIYFFNYSFPFIDFFDYKLLRRYSHLYIKLSLLENSYFVSEKKKKEAENIYDVNISNEDIFDLTKNNNKNAIRLLLLLSERTSQIDMLNLSEIYMLYAEKTKINEWIQNINTHIIKSVMGIRGGRINKYIFGEELNNENKEVIERMPEEEFNERKNEIMEHNNNEISDLLEYYSYFICLYFNLLYLVNKLVSNYVVFLPNMNNSILSLLDCIVVLCEGIFEEDNLSEKKIKNLILFLNNKDIEKYIIQDIITDRRFPNDRMNNKNEMYISRYKMKKSSKNALFDEEAEENVFPPDEFSYMENLNLLDKGSDMGDTNTFLAITERSSLLWTPRMEIGTVKIESTQEKGRTILCSDEREARETKLHGEEDILLRQRLFYEERLLTLHLKTKLDLKFFFENMTHFFILCDCDDILKFLQTVYITRYMNTFNSNILFYSIWLNAEFLKMYQVKNILFFLSLFKKMFILKNMDLGNSIYSWYNKQLIFFLRKKIEIYFENNTLEKSMKSVFILSDLLSHNKVIRKILLKKLVSLNFNTIEPSIFCQIFLLLNKLRFDASNKLFSELFFKHYKRIIHSLTYSEMLDLIKNTEYLISKKKRKIFVVLILYFFRKFEQSIATSSSSVLPLNLSYIFKLINIINKFKLYEYCNKDCFFPIYQFIFYPKNVQNDVEVEKKKSSTNDHNERDLSKHIYYSFLIRNNETIMLDMKDLERDNNKNDVLLLEEKERLKVHPSVEANRGDGKSVLYMLNRTNNETCVKYLKVKLEVLTTSQILDLIFFNINTRINIYLISELHTELFYRILRNVNFSKNQIILCFRSIWMSRVFHLNIFEALIDIITNNIKIVDNSIFALDILLCLCSYKYNKIYDPLIVTLFDICFHDVDKILKNMKKQVLFYYCIIFLELHYPLLFLKVIRKRKNILRKNEKNNPEMQSGSGVCSNKNIPNEMEHFGASKENAHFCIHAPNAIVDHGIGISVKMIGKNKPFDVVKNDPFDVVKNDPFDVVKNDPFDVVKNDPFDVVKNKPFDVVKNKVFDVVKNKVLKGSSGSCEKDGGLVNTVQKVNNMLMEDNVEYQNTVDTLKYLKHFFFIQQKKNAYSYDIIKFCELLEKLNITNMKINNTPNVFFKNHEIDDLFVLNVFYPVIKFCIMFIKSENVPKNLKKIIDMSKIGRTSSMHNVNHGGVDVLLNGEKNLSRDNLRWKNKLHHNTDNISNLIVGGNAISFSSTSFGKWRENDIDILAQKLYLLKNHKVNTMVIPIEKVDLFFKINLVEEQNSIIKESNIIFEKVYQEILRRKRKTFLTDCNILSSLVKKQLQYIFHL
ncbi:hypothetical protein, conserved [Plasmodium gonderi]|uniref:Uncharacterized protein n=1 Tax=Plasmodium gonderi TaxID=77519 RepID=A0A1Y1JRS8_PLAGO|nr:hypothetical protein, conserved [Plasmodium gonderi]GAW82714.1 hypothetical protein, conserved [Plasmodium gonderi]